MRIAIDARYVADHFPGIGRYVYNLVSALAGLAHEHTLVVLHNPAIRNTRHDIPALARLPGVELVATSARPFTIAEQVGVPRLLGRVGADLYHVPYYVRPYAGLSCPSVVTLYDVIPRRFPGEVSRRARILFDLLTRLSIRASERVIAISASARADLVAAYGIPADRIAVTPLAADPRFRPLPPTAITALRVKYGLSEQYVLSLASNKPHKNLPRLIAAWAEIAASRTSTVGAVACPLVVAGHWDPRYQQARRIVAERRLEAAVRFLPDVAEADLPALYGGALLFVFPSLYEGFGLPPLEAMACGTPVICSNTSSMPEVVGDSALLVDPTDVDGIAAGLARLIDDAALRAKLRAAGLQRAAGFSWARTATTTLAVYEQAGRERG
jgi:glycosyltransferase involved in cell wall biosynthesis